MPLTISWIIQNHVILIVNEGAVIREDIIRGAAIVEDMIDRSESTRIHVISDISRLTNVPDLQTLSQQRWVQHPKLGWLMVSGLVSEELKIVLNIVSKARRVKSAYMDTIEEALAYLYEHNPELSDYSE